jgi:hypothetical protein
VVELNDLEKELFSKVQTIDYYTTVVKIEGFQHMPKGFYYFGEHMDDPATIGNPVAMQRFFADTTFSCSGRMGIQQKSRGHMLLNV